MQSVPRGGNAGYNLKRQSDGCVCVIVCVGGCKSNSEDITKIRKMLTNQMVSVPELP